MLGGNTVFAAEEIIPNMRIKDFFLEKMPWPREHIPRWRSRPIARRHKLSRRAHYLHIPEFLDYVCELRSSELSPVLLARYQKERY